MHGRLAHRQARSDDDGHPLVSILMPNYNGEPFLQESISSGLAQTYRNFELIIVDDGSTDRSLDILRSFASRHPARVRLLHHAGHLNRGLVESYGLALSEARGSIVAFLECDDTWQPDNLERKVAILRRHPDVGVVHADFRPFGERRGSVYWWVYGWANRVATPAGCPYEAFGPLLMRNPIPSFTHFIMRRSLLDGIPRLETMQCNCDWWTLAHASVKTRFFFIPEKLTGWRIHGTSAHYGPVRIPLGALRVYLFSLYESLLATAEVARRSDYRSRIERARRTIGKLDPEMLEQRSHLLASLRDNPGVAVAVLADAMLRRLLFA